MPIQRRVSNDRGFLSLEAIWMALQEGLEGDLDLGLRGMS